MTEILLDYVENKLSPTTMLEVEARLETDTTARETVAWLRQFQGWREQVQLPQPNPAVIDRIVAQHARKFRETAQPTLWQRVTAALTFDSWAGNLAGARGADLPTTRQLAYSTPQFDVLLDIGRSPTATTLSGQLLPKAEPFDARYVVQLVRDDTETDTTVSDDLGEFTLTTTHTGAHQLIISDDSGADVWLPELMM